MSQSVLTGPLIDFGNSFWKSSLAMQEFPGLSAAGMKARGKYGIGFFSIFMLGDQVRVISRRFDRDMESARILEFRHGLGSRPNLRDADLKDVPIDGGTRIEVNLNVNPFEPEGILYQRNPFGKGYSIKLRTLIASIAPACDVSITVDEVDEAQGNTAAGDWLDISSAALLNRIKAEDSAGKKALSDEPWEQLSEIRDEDGKIYGRARININNYWSKSGLVTVDGLAAIKVEFISGILIGVETTASRNSADPIIPAPVLASWSSQQAILISSAEISDEAKAEAAAIVMACGGNTAELPIIWWQNQWMTASHFADTVKFCEEFILYDGWLTHDEDDDVTSREFESYFEADPSIAQTVDLEFGHPGDGDWIDAVTQGAGSTPMENIESVLDRIWGDFEFTEAQITIGFCNGNAIYRKVTIYIPQK